MSKLENTAVNAGERKDVTRVKCVPDEDDNYDGPDYEPDYDAPTAAERHEQAHAERRSIRGY